MFQKKLQQIFTGSKYTALMKNQRLSETSPTGFRLSDKMAETSVTYDAELPNINHYEIITPNKEEPVARRSRVYEICDYDLQLLNRSSSTSSSQQQPDKQEPAACSSSSIYEVSDYDLQLLNRSSSTGSSQQQPDKQEPAACSSSSIYEVSDYDLRVLNNSSSNSSNLQQPDMSEIRVVLLGNSQSEKRDVGNFILEVPIFSSEEEPDCQPVRGLLNDKEIVLINTPDLLLPNISEDKLKNYVRNCVRLSAPGPQVFLLVLQPETFTEDQRQRLHKLLRLFGERSFDHSLILLSTPKKRASVFKEKLWLNPLLKDLIKMCGYRCLWRKNLEHLELFTRLIQIVKENNGEHVRFKAHATFT